MDTLRKTIEKGIEGTDYYIEKKNPDPLHLSFVIRSKKSDNMLSVAYYRREYSAIHMCISEFPSIHPRMNGRYESTQKSIEIKSAEDIVEWLKTDKFHEPYDDN